MIAGFSFGRPRHLLLPRTWYLLCLLVLMSREGSPSHVAKGEGWGPGMPGPGPGRAGGSPLAELTEAPEAPQCSSSGPEPGPLQA